MSALEGRRQRAREAVWDAGSDARSSLFPALEVAIETATRARITREAIEAARVAGDFELDRLNQIDAALIAALAELGFEVEQ